MCVALHLFGAILTVLSLGGGVCDRRFFNFFIVSSTKKLMRAPSQDGRVPAFMCFIVVVIVVTLLVVMESLRVTLSKASPIRSERFSDSHVIYVINMKERNDKWEAMKRRFINEKLIWSEGVDVRKNYGTVQEYVEKGLLRSPNGKLKYGNLGCAIAHIRLWEEIADGHEEYALILEDDSVPTTNYLQGLYCAVNAAPDFDMINMVVLRPTGEDMNQHGMLKVKTRQKLNHANLPNVWASAYLLSKTGASKLLDLFHAHPFDLNNVHIDWAMVEATNDSAGFARYVIKDSRYFKHDETDSDRVEENKN